MFGLFEDDFSKPFRKMRKQYEKKRKREEKLLKKFTPQLDSFYLNAGAKKYSDGSYSFPVKEDPRLVEYHTVIRSSLAKDKSDPKGFRFEYNSRIAPSFEESMEDAKKLNNIADKLYNSKNSYKYSDKYLDALIDTKYDNYLLKKYKMSFGDMQKFKRDDMSEFKSYLPLLLGVGLSTGLGYYLTNKKRFKNKKKDMSEQPMFDNLGKMAAMTLLGMFSEREQWKKSRTKEELQMIKDYNYIRKYMKEKYNAKPDDVADMFTIQRPENKAFKEIVEFYNVPLNVKENLDKIEVESYIDNTKSLFHNPITAEELFKKKFGKDYDYKNSYDRKRYAQLRDEYDKKKFGYTYDEVKKLPLTQFKFV